MHVATSVSESYTITLLVLAVSLKSVFNEMLRQRSHCLLVTPCQFTVGVFSILKEKQTNKQTNKQTDKQTDKVTNKQLWTMEYI